MSGKWMMKRTTWKTAATPRHQRRARLSSTSSRAKVENSAEP
jgi:hypothetical protein